MEESVLKLARNLPQEKLLEAPSQFYKDYEALGYPDELDFTKFEWGAHDKQGLYYLKWKESHKVLTLIVSCEENDKKGILVKYKSHKFTR